MEPKPPLTIDQLREIGQRRKEDPDVRALLWEIKRLRDEAQRDHRLISRGYQLGRSLTERGGAIGMIANVFMEEIKGHPVQIETDARHKELFNPDQATEPGDDDD